MRSVHKFSDLAQGRVPMAWGQSLIYHIVYRQQTECIVRYCFIITPLIGSIQLGGPEVL